MKDDELERAKQEAEQSALAWFATMERAKLENNFALAAKAQRELARLGVTVNKPRASKKRKAVRDAR